MKVLFDTQIFDWQINGGISRYFVELINRLDDSPEIDVQFEVQHSYNTYLQDTKWLRSNPRFINTDFKGKLRIIKEINQVINRSFSNSILTKRAEDIFHATYYDPYFLSKLNNKPVVLTVYDLTNEKFPDGSKLTRTVLAWKKSLIERANHIISISENTKNDIVNYYDIDPAKITTIYLSGGLQEDIGLDSAVGIANKPYVLFVGSRSGYKNFTKFCAEVAPLLQKFDVDLYVVGGGGFNAGEIEMLSSLGIFNNTSIFAHVSDGQLAQFYRNALVFIFPSIYEGFGIPVLEAMKCSCPVLLSNNSSLPEVGGNAAVYFDPFTDGDLRRTLETMLADVQGLKKMKQLETEQLSKFSWDITAQKHIEVYKQVMASI